MSTMAALTKNPSKLCKTFIGFNAVLPKFIPLTSVIRTRFRAADSHKYKWIEDPDIDPEFRVLVIPGHTKFQEKTRRREAYNIKEVPPPRSKQMKIDQDWTNVWPAAHTFKWSAIPFPVRQGFVQRVIENNGIPPSRYANAELMKIPNFLHLTPGHIKKHCAALKKFCTKWPAELETDKDCENHFPIMVTTQDYVFDGASIRDRRSATVTLQAKLSSLSLDYHAKDKLLRLVGDRYNAKSDILTLISDRCPLKKQNEDYVKYLLTAVFHESWKTEPWEVDKTEEDMEVYTWHMTKSKPIVMETLRRMKQVDPVFLREATIDNKEVEEIPIVQDYKKTLCELHDEGESLYSLNKYKSSTRNLLNLPKFSDDTY